MNGCETGWKKTLERDRRRIGGREGREEKGKERGRGGERGERGGEEKGKGGGGKRKKQRTALERVVSVWIRHKWRNSCGQWRVSITY